MARGGGFFFSSLSDQPIFNAMILPIISLLVIVTLSLMVTRLAAVALTLTGLPSEVARFQARSALFGVGFTTRESEVVVNHPVRRRIIYGLMFIGNIGIPTVVATLVVSFFSTMQSAHRRGPALLLIFGLAALWLLARSRSVDAVLIRRLARALKRWTRLDVQDYVSLLQLDSGFAVTELLVEPGDWLADRSLAQAALPAEGILVLAIRRSDHRFIGAPKGTDVIRAGDTLVLYGPLNRLAELDTRRREPSTPTALPS